MKYIPVVLLFSLSLNTIAQTELQGGIYSDRVLSLSESPYHITGDVVLFPDKTLTIEPGVEIVFLDDYYLEIRGHLKAVGSISDTISFTTLNDTLSLDPYPWMRFDWEGEKKGLVIDYPTASFKIEYCAFSNFNKALHIYNIAADTIEIKHCVYESNLFGLTKFSNNSSTVIDSCNFINNSVGLYTDFSHIYNSTISDNYYGIRGWFHDTLINSYVTNNIIGIDEGGNGSVESSHFEGNRTAILNSGIRLVGNTIINNEIGIQFNLSAVSSANLVTENKICNSLIFNVKNISSTNIALNSNCWCTSDSAKIEEKIYDGYDNIESGLINYDIFNETCSSVLKSVRKINITTGDHYLNNINFSVFPNPFDDFLNVSIPQNNSSYNLRVIDVNGRIVHEIISLSEGNVRINTQGFESGLFVIRLNDAVQKNQKIIIKQ